MRRTQWMLPVLLLLLCAVPALAQEADPVAPVRAYVAAHPAQVGIACYPIGDPQSGVYHNADEPFPLASVYKVLVLAEYAVQVADGRLNPEARVPLADLNAYYLPGTDGGAHDLWLQTDAQIEDDTVSLHDVAYGMIRYSSNAAADYLLERVGTAGFPDLYTRLGIPDMHLPEDVIGHFLTFSNHETGFATPETLTQEAYTAESERLHQLFLNDAAWREALLAYTPAEMPPVSQQLAYFSNFGNRASPRMLADVMAAIYSGEALGEEASQIARDLLEWPMDFPANQAEFETLGTKGGTLPGILTAAYYAAPLDGQPIALTVFYRNLDPVTFTEWLQTFQHQLWELEILTQGCGVVSEVLS